MRAGERSSGRMPGRPMILMRSIFWSKNPDPTSAHQTRMVVRLPTRHPLENCRSNRATYWRSVLSISLQRMNTSTCGFRQRSDQARTPLGVGLNARCVGSRKSGTMAPQRSKISRRKARNHLQTSSGRCSRSNQRTIRKTTSPTRARRCFASPTVVKRQLGWLETCNRMSS